MKKAKTSVDDTELLVDLLHRTASIEAHLDTLFLMQCELFAFLGKSSSTPIAAEWGEVRVDCLKRRLDDVAERLGELVEVQQTF